MSDAPPELVEVLLVDDRPANLQALRAMLQRPDYRLVCAQSGEEALREVLRHDFAVILLDVNMPVMDGFELASTIKLHARYSTIPILFVTATPADRRHIFEAYRVGAVDYLEKPLDEDIVRSKVGVFVELHRQHRELERQAERVRDLEVGRLRMENERRYRNLADAIPQIVWIASVDGRAEFINRRWDEATGLTTAASLGNGWRAALHAEDAPRFDDAWATAIASGQTMDLECRLGSEARGWRWYLFRACPEMEDGLVLRWLGTFTDVDDKKHAEEAANAAIALRDEFLSIASHELRTPLTPLQLELQSLLRTVRAQNGCSPELASKRVSAAIRQTARLKLLIDSLLDVARISNGKLMLSREECDVADIVREVAERFRENVAGARCTLSLDLVEGAGGAFDRLRIEQVVTNLLANSLKYAAGTDVVVTLRATPETVVLEVKDHGMGIGPDQLLRIFDRFERAVSVANYGGLGLGLYIVRQIVSAHGGTVRAESQLKEGATFTAEIPRRPRATSVAPPPVPIRRPSDHAPPLPPPPAIADVSPARARQHG